MNKYCEILLEIISIKVTKGDFDRTDLVPCAAGPCVVYESFVYLPGTC